MSSASILVVDDDPAALRSVCEVLEKEGYRTTPSASGEEAVQLAKTTRFDVVLTDLRMLDVGGMDVLKTFHQLWPETVIILMTAFASLETVFEAIQAGAFDYLSKPFKLEQLRITVRRALEQARLLRENRSLKEDLEQRHEGTRIIGTSPEMVEVYKTVSKVAVSDTTVLVYGESGTGKELIARSIHALSLRRQGRFLAVNCGALAETLLESELFGYERGAFTGATTSKEGIFELCSGGTCFLDEIGDTSPAMQSRLLRVLQEGEIVRLGSGLPRRVDVRIVAATHRDLSEMVRDGKFREDLFYRLNVVSVEIPPLRQRQADIPLLFDDFLRKFSARRGKALAVEPRVMNLLTRYRWPGNVRELENVVERAVALNTSGVLTPDDFPEQIRSLPVGGSGPTSTELPSLEEVEKRHVAHVIEALSGNMTRAAEVLGLDRRTLYRMVERFGLRIKEPEK